MKVVQLESKQEALFQILRQEDKPGTLHADLCGPVRTASHGGSKYLFKLTDDGSRMSWGLFFDA